MIPEFEVDAASRKDLRNLANEFRKELAIYDELRFPIVEALDAMCLIFQDFNYEIVPDEELDGTVHAETDIHMGKIKIKETVYNRACKGEGRDRMTIAHEIGHYLTICFCEYKLKRNYKNKRLEAYRDPEWQAKCFAGELMIPKHLINGMYLYEIIEKCGVSRDAAIYQCDRYAQEDKGFSIK